MYIIIDKDAKIIEQNKDSWIDIEWITDCEDWYSYRGESNKVKIYINNDCLSQISLPAYYRGEIYYAKTETGFIVSDDIFWVASQLRCIYIDSKLSRYFQKKGYLPQGVTLFRNINRFTSNCTVQFRKGSLDSHKYENIGQSEFDNMSDDEIYNLFKNTLNNAVKSVIREDSAILLSGGVDSRLLLAVSKEYVENITLITSCSHPYFSSNCSDALIAERIAALTNNQLFVDTMDYDCLQIEELDPIIRKMPFSVHTSINFLRMCSIASKQRISNVLCGQNMDTLYNLGPTERMTLDIHGIGQWFKRFYLSEEFFKTLPDVEGKGVLIDKLIAKVGERMFSKASNQPDLKLPVSASELVNNFINSNDYTVFSSGNNHYSVDYQKKCTPYEIKKKLFEAKLSYLKGGDSQAVEVGGYLNGLSICLPYSDSKMIGFFSQLRLQRKDVFTPKRYSYKYLREFTKKYGEEFASFDKPSRKQMCDRFGDVEDLYDAFDRIISVTEWGREIQKGAGIQATGYTGLMKYDSLLRAYWYNRLIYILTNEYEIEVKNE